MIAWFGAQPDDTPDTVFRNRARWGQHRYTPSWDGEQHVMMTLYTHLLTRKHRSGQLRCPYENVVIAEPNSNVMVPILDAVISIPEDITQENLKNHEYSIWYDRDFIVVEKAVAIKRNVHLYCESSDIVIITHPSGNKALMRLRPGKSHIVTVPPNMFNVLCLDQYGLVFEPLAQCMEPCEL